MKVKGKKLKSANPKEGIYVSRSGKSIFILSDQDGPYSDFFNELISLYTLEVKSGVYRKVRLEVPFRGVRIGSLRDLK